MDAYRPRIMLVIVILAAIVLIIVAAFIGRTHPSAAAQPAPSPSVEYRVWERPIPVATQDCLKAIELGDRAITLGLKLDEMTTTAMENQRKGNLNEALKGFAGAKKLADQVQVARTAWNKQADRCVQS